MCHLYPSEVEFLWSGENQESCEALSEKLGVSSDFDGDAGFEIIVQHMEKFKTAKHRCEMIQILTALRNSWSHCK